MPEVRTLLSVLVTCGLAKTYSPDAWINVTDCLVPLSPRAPGLNPVENIWQFMRDNWLSNLILNSYEEIEKHCCNAWNKLIEQSARITSIGRREWAYEF
ncbi:hypothetical protein SAMN04515695_2806 [Pseudovibrio sp. Tun.PSC04-5.I4]|nr:hypothetical protein SAMN04515695_2806 [Pseudovibrio sp. Tun.PSC04-5.I4]